MDKHVVQLRVRTALGKCRHATAIRSQLDAIAREENLAGENTRIQLELLPLYNIVVGESLRQSEGGPGYAGLTCRRWCSGYLAGLHFIVILSACFNYTNLSIARAMRRIKEIGLRKAIGAGKSQVRQQFLAEAVMISLAALLLSFFLFLVLRPQLINMAPEMQRTVKLDLTPVHGRNLHHLFDGRRRYCRLHARNILFESQPRSTRSGTYHR